MNELLSNVPKIAKRHVRMIMLLYLATGIWLYYYTEVLTMYMEFGATDELLYIIKDYRYFIIIPTLFTTILIGYLTKNHKKLLFVGTLLIIAQILFMIYVIYAPIFQFSCVD